MPDPVGATLVVALAPFSEAELLSLLALIRGEGQSKALGSGLSTYPNGDANQKRMHAACLILEQRSLIQRRLDEAPRHVFWMPAQYGCLFTPFPETP